MATFIGNGSINNTYRIILDVNETGTSINNNTSTVHWNLSIQSTASYSFAVIGSTITANIGGIEVYNAYAQRSLDAYSTISIGSGDVTISHNSDGKKVINSYASYTQTSSAYYTPGNMSAGGDLTLTTIPRQANITSAPDFNDEENPVLQYKNSAGNSVSSLQARIENSQGTLAYVEYRDISKTGSSYTFNLTEAERTTLRNACPNSNTLTVKFVVKTVINGNTYWSTANRVMTIVNANPVYEGEIYIPAPHEDINPVTKALTREVYMRADAIVRKASIIRVLFEFNSQQAQKGALISKYRIAIGTAFAEYTVDYSPGTVFSDYIGKLNGTIPITGDESYIRDNGDGTYTFLGINLYLDIYNPDSDKIYMYVTDSRGNTNTNNLYSYANYKDYTTLFENGGSISATRTNHGIGTNVTLGIGGKFWNGRFSNTGGGRDDQGYIPIDNEIVSITYKYKKTTQALWIDGTTSIVPVVDGANYTYSGSIEGDLNANGFDAASSYDIMVIVEDKLTTIEFTTILSSAKPGMAIHQNGISFGAPYDKNSGGIVQINGINIFQYIYPVGAVYISTTLVDPATLFGGTWQRIEDRFLLAASEVYEAGSVGGEASHLLTVNEIPSHRHVGIYGGNSERKGGYGSTGTHTGTLNENTATEYETFTTGYTGGGQAHNNMPPYLSVYMWERIS